MEIRNFSKKFITTAKDALTMEYGEAGTGLDILTWIATRNDEELDKFIVELADTLEKAIKDGSIDEVLMTELEEMSNLMDKFENLIEEPKAEEVG